MKKNDHLNEYQGDLIIALKKFDNGNIIKLLRAGKGQELKEEYKKKGETFHPLSNVNLTPSVIENDFGKVQQLLTYLVIYDLSLSNDSSISFNYRCYLDNKKSSEPNIFKISYAIKNFFTKQKKFTQEDLILLEKNSKLFFNYLMVKFDNENKVGSKNDFISEKIKDALSSNKDKLNGNKLIELVQKELSSNESKHELGDNILADTSSFHLMYEKTEANTVGMDDFVDFFNPN